jgi:hypothetical protein
MDLKTAVENPARADARMLPCRGCGDRLAPLHDGRRVRRHLRASKSHRVPTLGIAAALVALAQDSQLHSDAAAAARHEWGSLLEEVHR